MIFFNEDHVRITFIIMAVEAASHGEEALFSAPIIGERGQTI